jgi:hypothetical protein
MKNWTFELDGHQGRAERYGSDLLEVFVFWRGIGCHLSGLVEHAQQIVLRSEVK